MSEKDLPVKMNREFKGIWIPREIWLHPILSIQAKVLWAEIDSLNDESRGGCYASDDYLIEFMGVKVSRLHEIMKELKDAGFLEKVSFNGRNRIIRAIHPKEVELKIVTGNQGSGKPEGCIPENRKPEIRETGTLPYNIYTSLDNRIDSPPKPPENLKEKKIANANEENLNKSSSQSKKNKSISEFSPEIIETGNEILKILLQAKPNYKIPSNLFAFHTEISSMIRLDKRLPKRIFEVLTWSLSDPYHGPWMFNANPAKKLREKFDQLEMKMDIKIPTNTNQVDRRLKDKEGKAVDEYKDLMF